MYLFVINGMRGGGAERVLQVLANHYARESKPVLILTLEAPHSDYPLDPRVTVRQLLPLPSWSWLRNLVLPLQWLALCCWVKLLRPKFCLSLLARSNFINILAGLATGMRSPISEHIHSAEEFEAQGLRNRMAIRLIRSLYPLASDIFCVSEGVKECLISLGVTHPRMVVVHNPIDLSEVGWKRPSISPVLRLISVGRLTPQKDHHTLLRAFQKLAHRYPLELHILGDGPLRDSLQALALEFGLADRVQILGWVDNVYEHLEQADIFVLSSRWEGFGNVLVEAMACGLPIVGTDCESGPTEILGEGKFGLLVPVADAEAMASALTRLIESPELREHFAELGRLRARDFSVEGIAKHYEEILLAYPP